MYLLSYYYLKLSWKYHKGPLIFDNMCWRQHPEFASTSKEIRAVIVPFMLQVLIKHVLALAVEKRLIILVISSTQNPYF